MAGLADAAEMESLHVMTWLKEQHIPALVLRAIADPAGMDMPCDFEAALDADGQIAPARLLGQLVRRPQNVPALARFGKASRQAAEKLAECLDRIIEEWSAQERAGRAQTLAVAG